MVTLSLVICVVATGSCHNFNLDRSFQTMDECETVAKELTVARVDRMRLSGYEFRGPTCHWLGGGSRG